ncbi:hypothetical protein MCEMSE15_02461 [Fimbriimonadaceae bacterium]
MKHLPLLAVLLFLGTLLTLSFQRLGTPVEMGKYRRDAQRWDRFRLLMTDIDEKMPLPKSGKPRVFPKVVSKWTLAGPNYLPRVDPLTGLPFEYRWISADRVEVCIDFELSSAEYRRRGDRLPPLFLKYSAGRTCVPVSVEDLSVAKESW